MISNEVLIQTILIGVLAGVLAVGIQRMLFKKSIVFFIAAIVVVPVVVGCGVGLILGARGVHHFVWAAPVVIVVTTIVLEIIEWKLRKPLNEMIKTINSLSQGDVNSVINEKRLKGENELAQIMRLFAKLLASLKNIALFADHVGKGKLDIEYTMLGENDSLGKAMLDMRINLLKAEAEKEERQQEDERRNWVTQGVAKFADLLRANHDNIEDLCQSIVNNLVNYIDANQAGLFLLNDEDAQNHVLELKACYAYDRRKFLQKTIEIGEGLVGSCFLERQSIYMNEIPKNYINITSGLGCETPRALLITPLRVNEDVFGIVEIASFSEFEPHVREFVEKVAESIASTISSVNVNIRTKKLLEQSNLQAEEMANQEEELRQNMEEMQATQEEMRRREEELQEILADLQESQKSFNETVYWYESLLDAFYNTPISVTDMDKKVTFLNKAALDILGKTREEVTGKHCGEVWGVDICKDERCGIEYLKCGKGKSNFNVGDTYFTTLASYVKDSHGNNIGHIEVVENITEHKIDTEEKQQLLLKTHESEQSFKEKVHWYESLLDAFYNTPISVTDMEKKVTFLNQAALDILGTTRNKVTGKHCGDVWGVDICKDERCGIEHLKCGKGKSVFHVEDAVFTTLASFVRDSKGNKIGHIEVVENITEATRDMEEKKYQLLKLNMVMDAAEVGLWDMKIVKGDPVNPNNAFVWSDAFRKLLGYTSEADFPNVLSSWSDKLHPEDKVKTLDAFSAHLIDRTGKTPYDLKYRLLKKNGEYGCFRAFGETTRDKDGYALRVAGGVQEINKERKRSNG